MFKSFLGQLIGTVIVVGAEIACQHLEYYKWWEFYTDSRGIRRRRSFRSYVQWQADRFKRSIDFVVH